MTGSVADPFAEFEDASPAAAADPFDEFDDADESSMNNATAFARGAVGGVQEGGMAAMGMTTGGMLGAPLGPVGMATGAALGGGAGFLAGRIMRENTIGTTDDLPEASRPFGVAGEIMGGGIPFAAAPIALGKMAMKLPSSKIGDFVNKIITTAAERPLSFFGAEMAMLSSSAALGGASEELAPGEPLPRFGAEVVGGMFNPARLSHAAARYGIHSAKKVAKSFSRSAQETQAAKLLGEILEESGEDVDVLAALLRDSDLPGVNLTAAQKTGSPALAAIEANLAKNSARFGVDAENSLRDGLQVTEGMITALRRTGDPGALRAAAEQRQRQFRMMLTDRVKMVEADAITAARKLSGDAPGAREAISLQAREALEDSLSQARAAEKDLWGKIPKETDAPASAIIGAYDEIRETLLQEDKLPVLVESFVERMRGQNGATTVGELLIFRSRTLELARDAIGGPTPDRNAARIFGEMAEAALDDLVGSQPLGLPPGVVDDARSFSKALNDTYGSTFAGKALQKSGGADRVPAELLLQRALATGGDAAHLKFGELEEATRFLAKSGLDSPEAAQSVDTMIDAQERMLRLAAAEAVDPQTGKASAQRLSTVLRRNEALFNRFPEARASVEEAIKSSQKLKNMEDLAKSATRIVDQRAAFSKLAKVENPVDAVAAALRGTNPIRDLKSFAAVARSGGDDAVAGLKAAVLDHIVRQGGDSVDPKAIRSAMFDPVRPGQPSVARLLTNAKVLDNSDVDRLKKILDTADKMVSTVKADPGLASIAEDANGLSDLLVRIQGARLGSALNASSPIQGGGLIAASAGSSFLRKLFSKMDVESTNSILIEAARDPELMAMLIKKSASPSEKFALGRQIHAYLLQAGFRFSADTLEGDE